jgi:hypothetical protein
MKDIVLLGMSFVGLSISIVQVYFPQLAKTIEEFFIRIANKRNSPAPTADIKTKLKNPLINAAIFFISKMVADFAFVDAYFDTYSIIAAYTSWEVWVTWIIVAAVMYLILFFLSTVLFCFWFIVRMLIWGAVIFSRLFIRISKFINPKAEAMTGFGLMLAMAGITGSLPF